MAARNKVVPPVIPRIVQEHPRKRIFRHALLFCVFILTAWFSYDYGRKQAPASGDVPVMQSRESERRITELKQERDALKIQVIELEQNLEHVKQTLEVARARIQLLVQAQSPPREIPASKPETAAVEHEAADNALKLKNVHIVRTESENMFRIDFSVTHDGDGSDRITGTIWIAVNGFANGEPKRLSLKKLSPDRHSFVKMGFDLQQQVTEELVLPEGFRPKNILIEAKPYGDTYTGTSMSFAWITTG